MSGATGAPTTAPTPALSTRTPESGPSAAVRSRSTAGERQMLPVQTVRTVTGAGTGSPEAWLGKEG